MPSKTKLLSILITIGKYTMDNQYPLIPEQQGDEDYKLNPYAPV